LQTNGVTHRRHSKNTLHTEDTAKVLDDQIANRDSKLKSIFIRKARADTNKVKTHTCVEGQSLHDYARVEKNQDGTQLR